MKAGLKLTIQKTKIMASGPNPSWQIDGETMETVTDFIFLDSKITADGDCSHEIKAAYQAPLPMGFCRQEYWSGVPLPSPSVPLERRKGCLGPREVGRLNLVGRVEPQKRGMEKSLWAQLPVDNLTVA